MQARINAVDGTLHAGPTPKGWSVELSVPLPDAVAAAIEAASDAKARTATR